MFHEMDISASKKNPRNGQFRQQENPRSGHFRQKDPKNGNKQIFFVCFQKSFLKTKIGSKKIIQKRNVEVIKKFNVSEIFVYFFSKIGD